MTAVSSSKVSFSEYLGRALRLYADNFSVLMNFSFACMAPTIFKSLLDATDETGVSLIGVLLSPVIFCIYTFFLMCLTYMTSSLAMNRDLTARDAVTYVRTKFFRGLGGYLLLSVGVIAGLFLLVLPGIYCFTVFYFFIFAVLFEEKGVWVAFKRSDELVRFRFWRVLAAHGWAFFLSVLVMLPFFVGMKMMGLSSGITTVIVGVLVAIVMPVLAGFYYFIYADLKVEHDGVMNISVHS
jgi:hypothetical protein